MFSFFFQFDLSLVDACLVGFDLGCPSRDDGNHITEIQSFVAAISFLIARSAGQETKWQIKQKTKRTLETNKTEANREGNAVQRA